MIDMRATSGMDLVANAFRTQRIRRDAVDRHIHRTACLQRGKERRRPLRLDAHHLDTLAEPERHTGNQPAAARRHKHGVQPFGLPLPFKPDGALSFDGRPGVESVDAVSATLTLIRLAQLKRIIVALALHHHVSAEFADLGDLRGRRNLGHEDARLLLHPLRRIGHGGTVIAAGGRSDSCLGHGDRGQRVEGTARLERTRVLEQFKLQRQRLV
jgi:hypothetical protein